ncbi:MAG TPA: serine protease [Solirubrobacteraceae bacterium]|jgi:secreted trypsin-like serine protease
MKIAKLATLATLTALLCTAAAQPTEAAATKAHSAVVGGNTVAQGQYPWIVATSLGCGGSLIAPDRVLTAGHCTEDLRADTVRLYVGARQRVRGSLRYDGREVRVADVATHPGYRSLDGGGPANDVAILRLATPVDDVAPVILAGPQDAAAYAAGAFVSVLGWGVTRTDRRDPPLARALRFGGLRMLSDQSCGRVYGDDGGYRSGVMLCARSRNAFRRPNTSPCVGDSGGPLITEGGMQVGVVSFGISCGALREPTVFAEVAGLRPFIDDPDPVWSPQPEGRPRISGRVAAGNIVSCDPPPFRNQVRRLRYRWGVNRLLVATGRRVRVTPSAVGKILQCRVVAENDGGTTPSAASPRYRVTR